MVIRCARCRHEWDVTGRVYRSKMGPVRWLRAKGSSIMVCPDCKTGDKLDIKQGDLMLMDAIKALQKELNFLGASLTIDGVWGPKTQAAITKYGTALPVQDKPKTQTKPWRDWFLQRKGWTEFNHDAELSKGWPLVGLPQYKTVIGSGHAWCGMSLATALTEYHYKIPHGAAGAANWDGYGVPLDWKRDGIPQGAIVRIRHASGGAHVTTADRDHSPGETVLQALGGNQHDSINVTSFNVSGNAKGCDEIMWCCWPVLI